MTGPLLRMVNLWQEFQQVGISIQRLGMSTMPRRTFLQPQPHHPFRRLWARSSLTMWAFRYHRRARRYFSMFSHAATGQIVGGWGAPGRGKVQSPNWCNGSMCRTVALVDGVDLAQIDPAWLRRQVGVVLQENFLFNRSVRDNIALTILGSPWIASHTCRQTRRRP